MITFYLPNGKIDYFLTGEQSVIDSTIKNSNGNYVQGIWDGETYYVENGQSTPRPNNPATLDNLTIRNLPVPCKIQINSSVYECDEQEVDLDFPLPGKYKVKVMSFPYLDAEFEIET